MKVKNSLYDMYLVLVAMLLLIMAGCKIAKTETESEKGSESESGMWVIVYHPMYQWDRVSADQVPWDHISHLSLGYLWPVESGG